MSASYPNGGVVFNISKATTAKELCQIEGVMEITRRQQGINLSGGHTNAMEFCQEMFGMPRMDAVLDAFISETQAAPSTSSGALWVDERKSA